MEGTPKAIEMKGIVRNATKIGVQDGQAEDLINLRFMDGSWRASGDGRLIDFTMNRIYSQVYIHTNIYRHLLGVYTENEVSTLYWFANIDSDGVTFTPLAEPVALTTVHDDLWITQTGHLLTVIDGADDFEHFVFKTGEDKYIEVNMDVNGKATDRSLYPFGQVHFNLYEPTVDDEDHRHIVRLEKEEFESLTLHQAHDQMISMYGEATKKNQFTKPFLVLAACRLYDGSYAFASQPVLIWPRDIGGIGKHAKSIICRIENGEYVVNSISTVDNNNIPLGYIYNEEEVFMIPRLTTDNNQGTGKGQSEENPFEDGEAGDASSFVCRAVAVNYNIEDEYNVVFPIPKESIPTYSSGITRHTSTFGKGRTSWGKWITCVLGSDLFFSVENTDCIDGDVIVGVDIFITNPADTYYLSEDSYKESPIYDKDKTDEENKFVNSSYTEVSYLGRSKTVHFHSDTYGNSRSIDFAISYIPKARTEKEIISDLLKSPFYLLKSYNKNELSLLRENQIVDLTYPDSKSVLENIIQQKTLDTEALSRTTYLPKVSYMYNGRLHIANYKSHPFFGYPIDLFHLHNHSVKVQEGAWFKGVLPNLTGNNDEYLQYQKTDNNFPATIPSGCQYFAFAEVTIETPQGDQKVVRYIEPYNTSQAVNGRADFLESLNPLITYPDARAKHIKIVRYDASLASSRALEFDLKPHPYLNMAYHIDPDLKPISITGSGIAPAEPEPLPEMQNTEEYFPNGLKVSKTDQPMFFPVENTYQVGSAEILALMSNTLAVGTGQTGAAPLYVFCKDGVYALYVDSSGQMAYPNARILARDVCNNPRSVTPIDAGVVFTTDRGLMMIAGEQVQEIGAPAEGEVERYWELNAQGKHKIGTGVIHSAFKKVAGLPDNLCDATDFLTYLQGAIINYNHNERELMVSNPSEPYSYIMDREGNWSRRDYTAKQYVSNYPTSYRLTEEGKFYKVDEDGDSNTPLEERKESDNRFFYLSREIKLDSIGFKQAYRFVCRGYFESKMQPAAIGSINGTELYFVSNAITSMSEGSTVTIGYTHFGSEGDLWYRQVGFYSKMRDLRIYDKKTLKDVTEQYSIEANSGLLTLSVTRTMMPSPIGCYVFGSYDGRKWSMLGGNEIVGKFTNIGCKIERTDVRFFRVCLAGQVTGKTRIEYMEMSAGASMLNTKIR